MSVLKIAIPLGFFGGAVGLGLGILYSVGGFFVDLFTTGLNGGTLLAFGALIGMPAIFGVAGFVLGLMIATVRRMIRKSV